LAVFEPATSESSGKQTSHYTTKATRLPVVLALPDYSGLYGIEAASELLLVIQNYFLQETVEKSAQLLETPPSFVKRSFKNR
jgi:hypothetical protein